jgi:hypothetical protein
LAWKPEDRIFRTLAFAHPKQKREISCLEILISGATDNSRERRNEEKRKKGGRLYRQRVKN